MPSTSERPLLPADGLARPARLRRRAIFASMCVGTIIVLADLVLRIPGLAPTVYRPRRIEPAVPLQGYADGPVSSFAYRPNSRFCSVYDPAGDGRGYFGPDGKVLYRINAGGMRGADVSIEKSSDVHRIICVGDSFTFGEGVREEDTYPAHLQRALDGAVPGKHTQVINAGVQAQGTVDELNWLRIELLQYRPDVVTLGFCLNDAIPFTETIRQHEERTRPLALSLPGRVSKIWEIAERAWWSRRKQDEFFETIRRSFDSEEWEACKRAFAEFHEESSKRGFRFVVAIFPIFHALDGDYPFADIHALVARSCRERGCECVDLLDVYRGIKAETLWVHPTDQHPNEIAHRLAAEKIAPALLQPPK